MMLHVLAIHSSGAMFRGIVSTETRTGKPTLLLGGRETDPAYYTLSTLDGVPLSARTVGKPHVQIQEPRFLNR